MDGWIGEKTATTELCKLSWWQPEPWSEKIFLFKKQTCFDAGWLKDEIVIDRMIIIIVVVALSWSP